MPQRYELPQLFKLFELKNEYDFNGLVSSINFEVLGKGRQGTVLVKQDEAGTPIVRTTSKYKTPAQYFKTIHKSLATSIEKIAQLKHSLNNALIETYTND